MIKRILEEEILKFFFKGKGIMITGPRQTGKTTLLRQFEKRFTSESIFLNCDERDIRHYLSDTTTTNLAKLITNKKLILIDEAQRVKNIGLTIKLLVDNFPERQVVVSGSSAILLRDEINEPLTGRIFEYKLYPLTWKEFLMDAGPVDSARLLEDFLIYGMYPEVLTTNLDKKKILKNIANSYLYKDVFTFKNIKNPEILEKLLQLLAYQVGSQVSYNELSKSLAIDNETVKRYIDLLEKMMIIFPLTPFSRNLRSELTKMRKIYFYDTGIRNSVILDFRPFEFRNDKGAIWENFLISERKKLLDYRDSDSRQFFWRTQNQLEIDYIEFTSEKMEGFEFKWNPDAKKKVPSAFFNAYPECPVSFIDKSNYQSFLE